MSRWLAPALLVLLTLPLAAQEPPGIAEFGDLQRRIEETLMDPPATGMMVTEVGSGSQAAEAGIAAGDVIVTYGGMAVPDQAALDAAKGHCAGEEWVEVGIAGPGGERTVRLKPGQIGVNCMPVMKGVPAARLPTATVEGFDFSALEARPLDDWYAFSLDGETKVGYEHARLALTLGKLVLRREVKFDGGEEFGVNWFDVAVVTTAGPQPDAFAMRFFSPSASWISTGRALEGHRWLQRQSGAESEHRHPSDLPRVPTYLVESLAAFLPRETGASFHFRPLVESTGLVGLRSAIVGVGTEELTVEGRPVETFRVEWRSIGGGLAGTYWFDGPGHALKVDYGAAVATRTTREKALEGLPSSLGPR